ncbi:YcaO-like family protein [Streptomyces sp. Pv4-95]|uniref:YcaO-like family protein n=1 Tax=Streptomyces sp. Pv4-95 TaxID=3049543 RepID=UPI0038914422
MRPAEEGEGSGQFRLADAPTLPPPGPTVSPGAARALELAAHDLGLRPVWQKQAEAPGIVSIWRCELSERGDTSPHPTAGIGKAQHSSEARLRALSEALERFLTGPVSLENTQIHFAPARELATGILADEASAPLLETLAHSELACSPYQSLHPGRDEVNIPLYLGAPWYAAPNGEAHRDRVGDETDYRALSRYSVSSGYGLAPTDDLATVHALLETVERDACSLLTLRVLASGRPLSVVDPDLLPGHLALLRAHAEREAGVRIHLLDATSDLGIPTVLAYCPPRDGVAYLRGQAAAFTFHQAVAGAVTELLETAVARRHTPPEPIPLSSLEPYPVLHRCARFDLTDALRTARRTPFLNSISPPPPGEELSVLIARLEAHGFRAHRRSMMPPPRAGTPTTGLSLVHTVVPGLERFFAILKGALIVPGPRGRCH